MAGEKNFSFDFEALNFRGGFDVDTDGFEYVNLKDLYESDEYDGEILPVFGGYITTDRRTETERRLGKGIGPHPVLILEDKFLNLPQHTTKVWQKVFTNDEACDAIREGHLGVSIYTYEKKGYSETFYSVNLHNM